MSSTTEQPQADVPTPEPTVGLTISAKLTKDDAQPDTQPDTQPDATSEKKETGRTYSIPTLRRDNTVEIEDDDWYSPRSRPRHRVPIRRSSISPVRYTRPGETVSVASSAALLSQVNVLDGIADLPYPSNSSVYLTTFPFTDKDVKKYAWLFASGIEDTFLADYGRDAPTTDDYTPFFAMARNRPDSRSRYYKPSRSDIPSAFLSRAVDTGVIPENSETQVKFWIVVESRDRSEGVKLVVAESRKAAGISMYYELLNGHSISFVGAVVVHDGKNMRGMKLKRVESLQEAIRIRDEEADVIGVIC